MKDLLKTYAPIAFLIVGAASYWAYGSVSALKQQNELLTIQVVGGCKASLQSQGYEVTDGSEKEADSDESSEDSSR